MSNVTSISRYQVISAGETVLPHKCIACGGDAGNGDMRDEFVDTGVNLDWYGAVQICVGCVQEMATVIGFIPSYEAELAEKLMNAEMSKAELERRRAEFLTNFVATFDLDSGLRRNFDTVNRYFEELLDTANKAVGEGEPQFETGSNGTTESATG